MKISDNKNSGEKKDQTINDSDEQKFKQEKI